MFLGNVIDLVIVLIQIDDKAVEFFLFAGLMVVVTIIFSIQAYFYVYVEDIPKDEPHTKEEEVAAAAASAPHAQTMNPLPSNPYLLSDPPNYGQKPSSGNYGSNLDTPSVVVSHDSAYYNATAGDDEVYAF